MSDSPLFWFFVFGTVGLIALVVIAPKHAQRQERLERMTDSRLQPFTQHARESPANHDDSQAVASAQLQESDGRDETLTVEEPNDASPEAEAPLDATQTENRPNPSQHAVSRSLLPLMIFLAALLAIAAAAVGVARYLRLAEDRADGRKSAGRKRGQVQ